MTEIRFAVLRDPSFPTCAPLAELRELIKAGRCPRLVATYGRFPGDCAVVTGSLALDITHAAPTRFAYRRIAGELAAVGRHYWIEADGWAFDFANGIAQPALVARVERYRAFARVVHLVPLAPVPQNSRRALATN